MKIYKTLSSFTKKDAEKKIDSLRDTICRHLLYVLVFGNTPYTKHWLNELSDSLKGVYMASFIKEGKRLKRERVYQLLHPGVLEHTHGIESMIQDVKESNADLKPLLAVDHFLHPGKFQTLYLELVDDCRGKHFSRQDMEIHIKKIINRVFDVELD